MSEWTLFDQPQPSLPDPYSGYSRSSDAPYSEPTTSKAAAEAIRPKTLEDRRDQVFAVIRSKGARGAACFEIAAAINVPQHWVTSSVAALMKEGLVMKSPRRVENPASGKNCVLLVPVRHG